jgi:glutamine amidotransferase
MKVAVVDCGIGNLGSVCRALSELGATPIVADRPEQMKDAERLILPGVGSFRDGMLRLRQHNLDEAIRLEVSAGKSLLGICLGMQLLASSGEEGGTYAGLDLIEGVVVRLDALGCSLRIPHVGWNNVRLRDEAKGIFAGIPSGTDFYFVHSYAFRAAKVNEVTADVEYGVPVAAAVQKDSVYGTQFHPEKSSKAGFQVLKNFLNSRSC